jgi:hypothetical protein
MLKDNQAFLPHSLNGPLFSGRARQAAFPPSPHRDLLNENNLILYVFYVGISHFREIPLENNTSQIFLCGKIKVEQLYPEV